tara:strand:+ start:1327 stop:1941 length:615 start_codon:yes stop_codon:yes gene_type:complete
MVFKLPQEAIADNEIEASKLSSNLVNSFVPIGGIIMWSGSIADAEALTNWSICDGQNGTPDLRDKFVLGVGSNTAGHTSTATVNEEGGSNSIQLSEAQMPSHNHDLTDPDHSHGVSNDSHTHQGRGLSLNSVFGGVGITLGSGQGYTVGYRNANENFSNANTSDSTGITINSNSTGITIQDKGSGSNIDIRSAYFALCYLIRVT